jgi:predicted xylose isomerase-like sugar epimerase
MEQGQFNFEEGKRRRDEAMGRADDHANNEWKVLASMAVFLLAGGMETFTTDDVWRLMATRPEVTTHEPRALGPVMTKAQVSGLIEPIPGLFRRSIQSVCHRRSKQVWRAIHA